MKFFTTSFLSIIFSSALFVSAASHALEVDGYSSQLQVQDSMQSSDRRICNQEAKQGGVKSAFCF
ncbi:hypothetical protein [Agarivorans sp. Alg241-V36]|uniref:hypothetical protein n=1 Tax=Agarivorans sp. Alg241-V36 TaxID=2305992 RepID=UPI0013D69DDB|nr:hypothetical protein [Agarivorans sp. Alg241-V36]